LAQGVGKSSSAALKLKREARSADQFSNSKTGIHHMKRYLRSLSTSFVLATLMAALATAQTASPQAKPAPPTLPPKSSIVEDPTTSQPDLGTIQDSIYTNTYFNLRIPVPSGWNVHDAESKRRLMQTGKEELSAAQPEKSASLDKSLQRTLNLLAFDNLNVSSAAGGAAALVVGAEPIPAGQTLTVPQYMEITKRLVLGVSGYEMLEDIHSETIGGASVGAMTVQRVRPGGTLKQKYIGLIRKGYAIFLVTAYTNEDAGRTLDDIFKRSKLN
jgi:hypothetical protein